MRSESVYHAYPVLSRNRCGAGGGLDGWNILTAVKFKDLKSTRIAGNHFKGSCGPTIAPDVRMLPRSNSAALGVCSLGEPWPDTAHRTNPLDSSLIPGRRPKNGEKMFSMMAWYMQ
ncbi:hypothetical protein BGX34_012224, partial [Mortierella sp. NVP85]